MTVSSDFSAFVVRLIRMKDVVVASLGQNASVAYEMIFARTKDVSKSKAGRWLAVLRLDYPAEYRNLVPNQTSHVSIDKAQTEKETAS